jgi:hypothetical protein
MKVDEENDLIISWSQSLVCFNSLETGQLIYKYKDIGAEENYFTDIIISFPLHYFITAAQNGQIHVSL